MAFMLTPKQEFAGNTEKTENPECLCNSFTMFRESPEIPFKLIRGNRIRGNNSYDQWGT